jgi:maltose O-acetyltransferase
MIDQGARIVVKSQLILGPRVYIGKNVTLVAYAPLEIQEGTLVAENVSIHTEDHGPVGARDDFSTAAVTIGRDAWLGAGVVVTKGVTIGARTTIGANAVVTKDIPSDVTAVGVPARPVAAR